MDYTQWVMLLTALAFLVLWLLQPLLLRSLHFWTAISISYLAFAIVNGILTAVPVVIYSQEANSGIRLGSIPLEDFFYSFALLSLNFSLFRLFLDGGARSFPEDGCVAGPGGKGSTRTPATAYRFLDRNG
ncbi:lycopene cyclase domain-containing protein [Marispirochaeta sp.]|uniref:lycopene cyclase domain-containing protein n=1 Tax=Marispirochaeta sp. TaxID=2038653 RepID=UPI0029C6374E|nr:lycopene cyclase domain-containing protein [Marispirochaeta sp.]